MSNRDRGNSIHIEFKVSSTLSTPCIHPQHYQTQKFMLSANLNCEIRADLIIRLLFQKYYRLHVELRNDGPHISITKRFHFKILSQVNNGPQIKQTIMCGSQSLKSFFVPCTHKHHDFKFLSEVPQSMWLEYKNNFHNRSRGRGQNCRNKSTLFIRVMSALPYSQTPSHH